jgi:hypothetical protein
VVSTLSSRRPADTRRQAFIWFKHEIGQRLGRLLDSIDCMPSLLEPDLKSSHHPSKMTPVDHETDRKEASRIGQMNGIITEAWSQLQTSRAHQEILPEEPPSREGIFNGLQYSCLNGHSDLSQRSPRQQSLYPVSAWCQSVQPQPKSARCKSMNATSIRSRGRFGALAGKFSIRRLSDRIGNAIGSFAVKSRSRSLPID